MSSIEMKYFKVYSEYDLGNYDDYDNSYVSYFKASSIKKVHRHLENYCCSCGLDYDEELEEGMFTIKEIQPDSLFINLEDSVQSTKEKDEKEATQWMRDAMDNVPYI